MPLPTRVPGAPRRTTPRAPRSSAARRLAVLLTGAAMVVTASALPAGAQAGPAAPGATGSLPRKTPRVTTPILSARRVPDLLRSHIADQRLAQQVKDMVKDAPPTSCFEVSEHGRPILRVNGDMPLEPASTNKLLTATALLQTVPADTKLSTTVVAAGKPEAGIVKGNVWLVGGGDATLTTAGYKPTFEDTAQLSSEFAGLADQLRAAGVTRIEGDIIGDDSRYDNVRGIATWTPNVAKESGPLSALLVNDGVTGYSTSPDKPTKVRKPGDPPVLAAETLKTLLTDRGITVTGNPAGGVAPATAVELARLDTPLTDVLTEMLSWSDNTTAELLLKELALQASHVGSTAEGLKVVPAKLTAMGLPTQGLVLNDGSGLDNEDRLTCDLLNALLDKQGPNSTLAKSLAIAGQRGTLRKRMKGTVADGKVVAKTGTLATVASLAGFVTTQSGDVLTFSFIENGQKDGETTALLDRLAVALYDYPQAPDRAALAPKPVT